MVIAIDVDDTLCHLTRRWLSLYCAEWGDTLTPEDLTHWNIEEIVKPDCGLKIFSFLDRPDLYDEVEPIEGAVEGVNLLREMGHHIIFATSTGIPSGYAKFYWLQRNGFFEGVDLKQAKKDYVEIRQKSLLSCDILVDDHWGNLKDFSGERVLFLRPHNRNVEPESGTWVADDWRRVIECVESIDMYYSALGQV
jgi:5'-nucleotidase